MVHNQEVHSTEFVTLASTAQRGARRLLVYLWVAGVTSIGNTCVAIYVQIIPITSSTMCIYKIRKIYSFFSYIHYIT